MGDINNTHGGGAAAGATFPVAMYMLFLSYLTLLLVPCSDLMRVLSLMCVINYACASVMLLSVIKLTRKLPNNPTDKELKWIGTTTTAITCPILKNKTSHMSPLTAYYSNR
jgi:hypothetical protein